MVLAEWRTLDIQKNFLTIDVLEEEEDLDYR